MADNAGYLLIGLVTGLVIGILVGATLLPPLRDEGSLIIERDSEGRIVAMHKVRAR